MYLKMSLHILSRHITRTIRRSGAVRKEHTSTKQSMVYTPAKKGSVAVIPPGIAHCIQVPQTKNATLLRIDLTFDYLAEAGFGAAQNTATVLFLPPLLQKAGISIPEHYTLSSKSQKAAKPLMDILISLCMRLTRKIR